MRRVELSQTTMDELRAMVDLDDRGLVDAPWAPWQNDALTPAEEVAIDDVVRRLRRTEATLVNEATIWSRVACGIRSPASCSTVKASKGLLSLNALITQSR